jgi:predicted site-specific integrase-resolvase
MAPLLVDAEAVQRHTGIPRTTLRRWVHEGRLCRYGSPRRASYDLREVDTLMALLGRTYRDCGE